ncbi:YceD family protein [Microbacterium luticocti]|uniref:YceD family protein n=1 Tax=Microbacterium luticocti TaxID=451764 RepID=UPI00068621B4|nr:YceD family protein [Microbacterium luticocti]
MREASFDVPADTRWGEGLVSVPAGEDVAVDVRLESVHEGILASGTARTRYTGECGRCLIAIDAPVEVEFQELFAYPGREANDFEVQDDHVDLETLVRDAIVLALPFQPVCRPDCPGLDPITGARLADEPDATPRPSVDPRWSALAGWASEPVEGENDSAPHADPDNEG